MRRLLVVALLFSMATPAFADIRESAADEARRSAQRAAAERPANPYFWPAVGLTAGGALLAIYGFSHTTGAEVSLNVDPSGNAIINAEEKKATGLGLVGLGVAAAGGVMYMMGNKKQTALPSVQFGARRVALTHRLSF